MIKHPLIEKIKPYMSEKRLKHTLGVAEMAEKLAAFSIPERTEELIVAALLHDISKELSHDEQMDMIKLDGILLEDDELCSPEIFHSYTAPYVIKRDFPEYASEDILSAVRNHTVGAVDMTVFDEIIFLSDYIEEGRTYQSCIDLRHRVLLAMCTDTEANTRVLHRACIESINNTERALSLKGKSLTKKTLLVKKSLESKI